MNEPNTGDSIVDEVYAIRAQIAEECGFDIRRILEQANASASKIPGLKYVTLEQMQERRRNRATAKPAAE